MLMVARTVRGLISCIAMNVVAKLANTSIPLEELHKDEKMEPRRLCSVPKIRRKRESDDAKKEKARDFAFAVQIAKDNDLGEWADR